jgi:hypothetical protein
MAKRNSSSIGLDILAYAPTEFFHCQHCELVWQQVGLGDRFRAERRQSGLLPRELAAEYARISDWIYDAFGRYDDRLTIRLIDAVSLEGIWKALRHRTRRFPAFIFSDGERISGFDRPRLDAALAARVEARAEATQGVHARP